MKKAMRLFVAAIGLALCVVANAAAANSITYTVNGLQVTLTDLGVLPTGTSSSALAINNRSEIAGSANVIGADNNWQFVLPIWDANTGAVVGMAETSGAAIPEHRNDNGEMVGTDCVGTCGRMFYGFYWSPAGLIFRLPPLEGTDPLYGSTHTSAHGINNVGQIVGQAKEGDPTFDTYAALWQDKDTLAQRLGSLGRSIYGMISSVAYGINERTHVVGNSTVQSDSIIHAFLWRDGRMIDLSASSSGPVSSEAHAINNNGLIAGKRNIDPVIWKYDVTNPSSTPVLQILPIPTGFFTAQPTAVNEAGDVAGYAGSPNIDAHAILWRGGKAFDLGIWPGGHYSVANGINNLGQIVGTGTVAGDNLVHALMWTVAAAGGGGGGGGTTTTTNKAPSASLQATSSTSIRVGGSVSVQAGFADPDNGPWSYKLDWGDGGLTVGNASSAGTISGISPHVYTRTGSFKARITVTDRKGAAGSSNTVTVRVR
jgi:probable HAF family extracellular repeat protein